MEAYNMSRRMKELGIRSVMHVIFECAARWELFNERRNPIEMVRVKDSKRRKRPTLR
jgi:integrase